MTPTHTTTTVHALIGITRNRKDGTIIRWFVVPAVYAPLSSESTLQLYSQKTRARWRQQLSRPAEQVIPSDAERVPFAMRVRRSYGLEDSGGDGYGFAVLASYMVDLTEDDWKACVSSRRPAGQVHLALNSLERELRKAGKMPAAHLGSP